MGDVFNWVSLVLQVGGILGPMLYYILTMKSDIKLISQSQAYTQEKLTIIDARVNQLGQVMIDLAKQDQRLNSVEASLRELSSRVYEINFRREDPLG